MTEQSAERAYLLKKLRYIAHLGGEDTMAINACPILTGRAAAQIPEPSVVFEAPPDTVVSDENLETAMVLSDVINGMSKEVLKELTAFFEE